MFANARHTDLLRELSWLRQRSAELQAERARGLRLDHLTGLLSAGVFRDRLAAEAERAQRYRRRLTAAIVAVDDFHSLEQEHGLTAADGLLAAIAHRLSVLIRERGLIGRTGKAEFGLALPDVAARRALPSLERLREELQHAGHGAVHLASASMGVAELRRRMSPEGLLASARIACEHAQRGGGGRVVLAAERDLVATGPGRARREAIEALAAMLLERDRRTGEVGDSVIELSGAVARRLGCTVREVERIGGAALLHNLGKVGLPEELLRKQAPESAEESRLLAECQAAAQRTLRRLPGLATVAGIVRHEHERWDGHGYPDGLAGERIPLGSRIVAAAAAYHEIVTPRTHRAAGSHEKAVEQLTAAAGTRFDPRVTEALIDHVMAQRRLAPAGRLGELRQASPRAGGAAVTAGAATCARVQSPEACSD